MSEDIEEPPDIINESKKEIRTKLPERQVRMLHRIKTLDGYDMEDIAAQAIDEYLEGRGLYDPKEHVLNAAAYLTHELGEPVDGPTLHDAAQLLIGKEMEYGEFRRHLNALREGGKVEKRGETFDATYQVPREVRRELRDRNLTLARDVLDQFVNEIAGLDETEFIAYKAIAFFEDHDNGATPDQVHDALEEATGSSLTDWKRRRVVNHLRDEGMVEKHGQGPATVYRLAGSDVPWHNSEPDYTDLEDVFEHVLKAEYGRIDDPYTHTALIAAAFLDEHIPHVDGRQHHQLTDRLHGESTTYKRFHYYRSKLKEKGVLEKEGEAAGAEWTVPAEVKDGIWDAVMRHVDCIPDRLLLKELELGGIVPDYHRDATAVEQERSSVASSSERDDSGRADSGAATTAGREAAAKLA